MAGFKLNNAILTIRIVLYLSNLTLYHFYTHILLNNFSPVGVHHNIATLLFKQKFFFINLMDHLQDHLWARLCHAPLSLLYELSLCLCDELFSTYPGTLIHDHSLHL
jgi:hypothetical protein